MWPRTDPIFEKMTDKLLPRANYRSSKILEKGGFRYHDTRCVRVQGDFEFYQRAVKFCKPLSLKTGLSILGQMVNWLCASRNTEQ